MNHLTCQIPNASKHELKLDAPAEQSRRKFFKFLGGGAAALALQACGGGGVTLTYTPNATSASTTPGTPVTPVTPVTPTPTPDPVTPTPVPTPAVITWQAIPAISFVQGTASTFSVADYVSVANATSFSLSLSSSLPPGVTFDTAARAFVYDGKGAIGALDGVVLTATVA